MFLSILGISILSLISPLLSLIFAVPYFSRIYLNFNKKEKSINSSKTFSEIAKLFFLFTAFIFFFAVVHIISFTHCFELIVSVGLSAVLFAYCLNYFKNFETAILLSAIPGFVFIGIKNLLFFERIKLEIVESNKIVLDVMEKFLSPEMYETFEIATQKIQNFMLNYNAAVWLFSIITGVFIGALIFSKKSEKLHWDFSLAHFPFYLQTIVAISLILIILKYRIIGLNILIVCGFFYLIQGYSLLYFFLRNILKKHKFLGILMLIIPIFSYYILIIISLSGLLEDWLHIRKFFINKGEAK